VAWESDIIPGHAEAVASERIDRALAFLPLPESIFGIECVQLTPLKMEWLKAGSSPFVVGGIPSVAAVLQFLWIVNPAFCRDNEIRKTFIASHLDIDYEYAINEIDAYLDRAFLDAPDGDDGASYYSAAAGLIHAMQGEPFRWDYDRVMNTSFRIEFQLLKAHQKSLGEIVINRRSQKVECEWLEREQARFDATKQQEVSNG